STIFLITNFIMINSRFLVVVSLLVLTAEYLCAQSFIHGLSSNVVTTPVLADQSINVVKRYVIESGSTKSAVKMQLDLSIAKQEAGLIEGFEIWRSLKDTSLLKESNKANYERLGQFTSKKGRNKLSLELDLKQGKNVLWLSMKVAPIKDAMHSPLRLTYGQLRVDGKDYAIDQKKVAFH